MPRCKHYKICQREREALYENGFCILHSEDPDKDQEAFNKALKEHRRFIGDNFRFMVFPKVARFSWVTFEGKTDFSWATFQGQADFHGATFEGETYFSVTRFEGETVFFDATFIGEIHFSEATFTGETYFSGATFEEKANFPQTRFEEKTSFHGTTFGGEADFYRARFKERAGLSGATFQGEAFFFEATFHAFNEKIVFRGSSWVIQNGSPPRMDFRDVTLDPPNTLVFRNADLRKCQLLGTDVRKIEFTGVQWAQRPRLCKRWKMGGNYAYDELYHREKKCQNSEYRVPWSELERLYRELKQNYEDRRNYARAGDFHYREKEMQRRNPTTSRGHKTLLRIYWLLSGYGERIWPAAGGFLFIIVACAFLYLQIGVAAADGGASLNWGWKITGSWSGLGEALVYSARTSFLLRPSDFQLTSVWAKVINLIQTVFSPIVFGLMALAIRQRLKR